MVSFIWIGSAFFGVTTCFPDKGPYAYDVRKIFGPIPLLSLTWSRNFPSLYLLCGYFPLPHQLQTSYVDDHPGVWRRAQSEDQGGPGRGMYGISTERQTTIHPLIQSSLVVFYLLGDLKGNRMHIMA